LALTAINAREAVRAHTLASGTLGKISVGIGDTRRGLALDSGTLGPPQLRGAIRYPRA